MKRHVAALLAIALLLAVIVSLLLGAWRPATSQGAPERPGFAITGNGSALPGVPLGAPPSLPAVPHGAQEPILSVPANHDGAVGTAIYSASMTWCAPTPTQCQGWGGDAELAAVNSFTWGDRPYWVRIWRGDQHADALVVSHCACNGQHGYIDVSPHVFRQLAALSRGRVDVAVEVLDGAPDQSGDDPPEHEADASMRVEDGGPTLPPTDLGAVQ